MRGLSAPRLGLAHRTMLLLVAAVFGSLAVLAAAFTMQRRGDFADFSDQRARGIAAQVHSIRLVLESVPAAYRRSVSDGLRSSGTMQAFPSHEVIPPGAVESGEALSQGSVGLARRLGVAGPGFPDLSEAIGRYIGHPAEVRFTLDPAPGYWVRQQIDGSQWWIVVLAGTPPPAGGGVPWPAFAAVLFALLGIAAWYAATITRPLGKLAAATHRIGERWPDPVCVDGPAELRELADSFNAMLVRLRQIEDERRVLLGGLPHDLRAPLTRLRLRLATLTELGEHPGIAEDIASIDHIVRQFTEYLRGVQPDEPRERLDEIVRSAVHTYQNLGWDVRAECGAGLDVPVPQFAVRRLLDNLIQNAAQHGQPPIRVVASRKGPEILELAVTDHGEGISREAAETAMEPFTKLDPARGRGGCGLGLAIVRQLTRQLGGGVRFEKNPHAFSVVASIGVQ